MSWLPDFLRRGRIESELAEEFREHLMEKVADLMDEGVPEAEAHARAKREFGNATHYHEVSREVWGWTWFETIMQDVRYGARMLRKNPGFTAVAAITLALGIAVNSTIFSVVSVLLLRKPAAADPDRVVALVATNARLAVARGRVSAADFRAWRAANHSFTDLAAADPDHIFSLTGAGDPERTAGMRVTTNYFDLLGVAPFLGRTFQPGEDQPGRNHVVLLSYGLWQRRFAADPNVAGKTVDLDDEKYEIIGVMPAFFRQVAYLARLWTPLDLTGNNRPGARDNRSLIVFGRLRPGADADRANAEAAALAARAEQADAASEKGWSAKVLTLQEYGIQEDQTRSAMSLLMAAVGIVLLIACANIANLLLARGTKRQQEIAIRTALGAGRNRVVRQLLLESFLIALLGASMGLAGAYAGTRVLRNALSFNEYVTAMAVTISLDRPVLIYTLVISIGAALIFGLVPALRVSAADPQATLRQGGRAGDLRRGWGRNLLVGAQIALATVLVIGASLMLQGAAEELWGDFGFDAKHVMVVEVALTSPRYRDPARREAFLRGASTKIGQLPGVAAAGIANGVPFNSGHRRFSIQGQSDLPPSQRPRARYFAVNPEDFRVLNIPILRGRVFRESDAAGSPRVAIVNRAFAERFFAGQNPLGRYIRVEHSAPAWSEIIGIAGNITASDSVRKDEDPHMYEPHLQAPADEEMWMTARVTGDPNSLTRAVRSAIWSVDPNQPIGDVRTIAGLINENDAGEFVCDGLLAVFGLLALILAAVGVYGVVEYAVEQRTHEIGIRMALGGGRRDVLPPVLAKEVSLALAGAALGIAAALPLPKLFFAMFNGFRIQNTIGIFLAFPAVLLAVVFAAVYIPAARAARVDPVEALRYE